VRTHRCWAQVVDPLNVWRAWREFAQGKQRRQDVAAFALHAETEVARLARELAAGGWRPRPYQLLRITDPKRRLVAAAPVRDRVVHHAVHRVVAPLLNRRFIHHSYACLEGRGVQRALLAAQGSMRRHRWRMHLDIRRYFYSIDRQRLRGLLVRSLPEPPLRALLDRILASGDDLYQRRDVVRWLGWEAPLPSGRGLPIGNLTSQWWGNLYLDGLDHHVCRLLRPGAYQRYMDDIVLFGAPAARLVEQRERIASWLAEHRGLTLKDPSAEPISTRRPFVYLGHRVTRTDIQLGRKARQRLRGRLAEHADDPARVAAAVRSYAALWTWGA